MKLLKQFTVIVISLMATSCQKHDDTPAQPDKVVIDITSLQDGQTFKKGDVIKMQGTISYISQLHGYQLTLKNKETGKEIFYHYEHTHSDKVSFNQSWTDTLSLPATIQLLLTAEIDHDGNSGQKELIINSQP